MTEDEAKTKICHRSIDGDDSPAPVIGNDIFAKKFACVASACMAWRWGKTFHRNKESGVLLEESHHFRGDNRYELVTHGYCGLAGKP